MTKGTFYQDTPVPAPDHLGTPGYTITGRKPLNTLPLLTPESTQRVRFERGAVGVRDGTAGAADGVLVGVLALDVLGRWQDRPRKVELTCECKLSAPLP